MTMLAAVVETALDELADRRVALSPLQDVTAAHRAALAAQFRALNEVGEQIAAVLDAGGGAIELGPLLVAHSHLGQQIGDGLEVLGSLYSVAGSA